MLTTIGKLFNIVYGQKEYHNKERLEGTEGNNILISSKGQDNGLYGFFDISTKFKAPFITVQGYGTIGHAFVQEYDCSVDDHMLILIPKGKISLEELYQVAYQIRLTKWKYRYGRGITPDRIKKQPIVLVKSKLHYDEFVSRLLPDTRERVNTKIGKIRMTPLTDLCNIERVYSLYMEEVDKSDEKVPYITTSEFDNGLGIFCNERPIFKKGSITVSLDGKSGLTFFQVSDFISGEKTAVLTPKSDKSISILFYIGAIIRAYSWRYNYGRKLSIDRLQKIQIPMPIDNKGNYDVATLDKLFNNSYGSDELKRIVKQQATWF